MPSWGSFRSISTRPDLHLAPERGGECVLRRCERVGQVGVDGHRWSRAASLAGLGCLCLALGLSHRPAFGARLASGATALYLVAVGEDRAAVALREQPPGEQVEGLVGQVEQADQVRDRDAAAPDAPPELILAQPEVVDQRGAGPRLLDRAQILARDVLDQGELELLGVLGLAHDGRNLL